MSYQEHAPEAPEIEPEEYTKEERQFMDEDYEALFGEPEESDSHHVITLGQGSITDIGYLIASKLVELDGKIERRSLSMTASTFDLECERDRYKGLQQMLVGAAKIDIHHHVDPTKG